MDDLAIEINDNLYKEENESENIVETTETILPELDDLLTERVQRITIKGQIDGN